MTTQQAELTREQIERYRDDAAVVLKTADAFSDEYAAARAITELSASLLQKMGGQDHLRSGHGEPEKYVYVNPDDALRAAGIFERMRLITETAVRDGWRVDETMRVIKREIALVEDEVKAKNNKAHDEFVRRKLGVDADAVISDDDYVKTCLLSALRGTLPGS